VGVFKKKKIAELHTVFTTNTFFVFVEYNINYPTLVPLSPTTYVECVKVDPLVGLRNEFYSS